MAKQSITAVIYDRRGRVMSIGQNSYIKTHPMQAKYAKKVGEFHKIFLHAEIAAITRCQQNLKNAYRMVVTRYDKNGNPALAKPCAVCQSAIRSTNIKYVEHT